MIPEKRRHFWLVTFVTHNARVSDRMREFKVRVRSCVVFDANQQLQVAVLLTETWNRYGICVLACNVLPDHVHAIIAAEDEQQLDIHVQKLKGYTSRALRAEQETIQGSGESHIWQQKFNRRHLRDEHAFYSAQTYVLNNHLMHLERWGEEMLGMNAADKGLKPLAPATRSVREQIQATLAAAYFVFEEASSP